MGFGRIAALALTALLLPAAAEGRSYGIEARGSAQGFGEVLAIGDFKPRRDPTLGAAIDAYGPPASTRPVYGDNGCKVSWPGLGVKATFANFGTGSACDPDLGKVQGARAGGLEAWHTARGLHVGDGLPGLRRRYPGARRHGSSYWLVTGVSLYGPHPQRYPVLAAVVREGEVRSFKLEIGAAGD
jgi:hypothetical protein